MKLNKKQKDFCSNYSNNIDLDYYLEEDDDIKDIDDLEKKLDDDCAFVVDIIYSNKAIEYLAENDASLLKSTRIMEDLGYKINDINSEMLASFLASEIEEQKFQDSKEEISEMFFNQK